MTQVQLTESGVLRLVRITLLAYSMVLYHAGF